MFIPLFAWSWTGHGDLTTLAMAAAIAQVIKLGKSDLMKRFARYYKNVQSLDEGENISNLYEDVERDSAPSATQAETALTYMFGALPGIVQRTDLHLGNIPWGVGEFLDGNGQVRHFMRSTEATTQTAAYQASRGWIKNHLAESFGKMKSALYTNYKMYNILSSNGDDFNKGLTALGEALHTVEDSYAPGHVGRDASLHSLITQIHYWDNDNKTAHGDWPGHEALDDPKTPMSVPYYKSAQSTTTEIIVCLLANLESDAATFGADLNRKLDGRFQAAFGARVLPPYQPTTPPRTLTG